MKRHRLPKGISDYKTLVEKNYIYIDKTEYIEKLEYSDFFVFFLRPRRFGKSLFTSVLEYYYGINHADKFERLFGNTYIGKNKTEEKNSYYILKFSFTGLETDTEERLLDDFRRSTLVSYRVFCETYGFDFDYLKEGTPAAILHDFLSRFKTHADGAIYIIIDEYDHFANELLGFRTGMFSDIVAGTGFVRKWFEKIKDGTADGTVGRFFATGVSPITLDSLTSGFNIATDYTRNIVFNEMMGFTEDEVRFLLKETLGERIAKEEPQVFEKRILDEMRRCYNGYLFSGEADKRVFNSNMTLNYLAEYFSTGKPPETLLDVSIASDYSKMEKMFALKNKSSNHEILREIIDGKEQTAVMTVQYNLEKQFDKNDFLSLLFYFGYLTMDGSVAGQTRLKVPNYVVKELYFSYFEKILREDSKYDLEISGIQSALAALAIEGDNAQLVACIETILASMSNRDSIKMDEKYVKTVCFTICMLSKCYIVESENETNKGYLDIQLLQRPGIDVNYYALMEFKYLPKKDGTEENVERKLREAREQLGRYTDSPKFQGMDNLKKWAVVFVGDKCVRNETMTKPI